MRSVLVASISSVAVLVTACSNNDNASPTVSAGSDQSVVELDQVQLSGSASDPDGDSLTLAWSQVSGPMVTLSSAVSDSPTFQAPNTRNGAVVVMRFSADDGVNPAVAADVTIEIADTPRSGTSPQGIDDNGRDRRRNDARDRPGNRPMVGGIEVRTYDGSANNLANTDWGAAFEHLQRLAPNDYADGISQPAGPNRASARVISNAVHNQDAGETVPNAFNASDFVWQWGQFIDHDVDLTDGAEGSADIEIPAGDVFFDPLETGSVAIPFNRALFDPDTGTSTANPREQENEITSWIDGSMVYGSDDERAQALRDIDNPHLLAVSDGNLLPFNTMGLPNANIGADILFVAGDVRVNEQVGLAVMHTLFVREHNRMARRLMDDNPNADADDVFETARRLLIGKIQHITYNEWLPALIGDNAIADYTGYDESINPTVYNEFSMVAFRLGHTLLNEDLLRIGEDGNATADGPLPLADAFFAAHFLLVEEADIDPFLRGFASRAHQALDTKVVSDVRNFLFGEPGSGGLDLVSLTSSAVAITASRLTTTFDWPWDCQRVSISMRFPAMRTLSLRWPQPTRM